MSFVNRVKQNVIRLKEEGIQNQFYVKCNVVIYGLDVRLFKNNYSLNDFLKEVDKYFVNDI